ncbi:g9359 [Coccomyxa elongata]
MREKKIFVNITNHARGVRGVLHLGGEDVYHFLNGIITNDPNFLRKGAKDVMYTAFLNAQGRFLHDAFLYATGEPFGILADVDKAHMPALMRLLRMYKLRAKMDVRDVSDSFDVWARFGIKSSEKALEDGWPIDPRTEKLGQRTILPKGAEPALELPASDSALYEQWRHSMGVAEGPSEIPSGSAVPLEYNLDGLNAISFTKGCYVGQELIARTHFRGIVRKRLLPVTSEPSSGPLEEGMDVYAEGAARSVGKVVVAGNSSGTSLALLRLQAAFGDRQLRAGSKEGPVIQPHRPSWWPPEWGTEEHEQQ